MKIPTLIGLAFLAIVLGAGIVFAKQYQYSEFQTRLLFKPQNIKVVNITDSSAAIVWQTQQPAVGSIIWGKDSLDSSTGDDRNTRVEHQRYTHFVTINNLEANSRYSFRVRSNNYDYSDTPLEFTTAKKSNSQNLGNTPIIGTILNSNYEPADEALVFLNIEGAAELATYTVGSGNFLLPTTQLRKKSLEEDFPLTTITEANLTASKEASNAHIKINLPVNNQINYQIILGQNEDLRNLSLPNEMIENPLDLNGDGAINTLDLAIVLNNFGKNPKNKRADINQDGAVDKKDLDELKAVLR